MLASVKASEVTTSNIRSMALDEETYFRHWSDLFEARGGENPLFANLDELIIMINCEHQHVDRNNTYVWRYWRDLSGEYIKNLERQETVKFRKDTKLNLSMVIRYETEFSIRHSPYNKRQGSQQLLYFIS